MSGKLRVSILMNAALFVVAALALRALFVQRQALAEMRAEIESRASAPLPNVSPAASAGESQSPHEAPMPMTPSPVPPVSPKPLDEIPTPKVEFDTLRKQNEGLVGQVQELEAQLAQTKRLVPEPDDPAAAYVGPGTWINPNAQTRSITKIVISAQPPDGHLPRMTISAWGKCSPTDCEWGEVPLFLLDYYAPNPAYRRGLAVWEHEGGNNYLIVTFEKAGLKLECASVTKQRLRHHLFTIDSMARIN